MGLSNNKSYDSDSFDLRFGGELTQKVENMFTFKKPYARVMTLNLKDSLQN